MSLPEPVDLAECDALNNPVSLFSWDKRLAHLDKWFLHPAIFKAHPIQHRGTEIWIRNN